MANLHINVRYAREMTDSDIPVREENLAWGELSWSIPPAEAALVLVDCWADYPLITFARRAAAICRDVIRPTVAACRRAGVAVVHAPGPQWAANYGAFHVPVEPASAQGQVPRADWPPPGGRPGGQGRDPFAVPRCGDEPVYRRWWERAHPDGLKIVPEIEPVAGDAVISTGAQLHRLCRERRIVHLFYAGFATNICVRFRDYGVHAMHARGYNLVLLRDATTGIESATSLEGLWQTQTAIHYVELKLGVSALAADLTRACAHSVALTSGVDEAAGADGRRRETTQ